MFRRNLEDRETHQSHWIPQALRFLKGIPREAIGPQELHSRDTVGNRRIPCQSTRRILIRPLHI